MILILECFKAFVLLGDPTLDGEWTAAPGLIPLIERTYIYNDYLRLYLGMAYKGLYLFVEKENNLHSEVDQK